MRRLSKTKGLLISALTLSSILLLSDNIYNPNSKRCGAYSILLSKGVISRPEKLTDKLQINTSRMYKLVSEKSEAEGIEDLKELVNTADVEEAWYYDGERWVENGIEERKYKVLLEGPLEKIINNNKSPTFYHIHPLKSYESEDIQSNDDLATAIYRQNEMYKSAISGALPSLQDMYTMVSSTIDAWKKDSNINPKFKVVSPFGVTEYSLTKKGLGYFGTVAEKDLLKVINLNLAYIAQEETKVEKSSQVSVVLPRVPDLIGERHFFDKHKYKVIQSLLKGYNYHYFDVSFSPHSSTK